MNCTSSNLINQDIKPISNLVFGYLITSLRGIPIKYILELANYSYSETRYTPTSVSSWFEKDKYELGLDYPNLPYLIHGELTLSESQNIVNYVIELTQQQSLLGIGDEKYKVDNIRFLGNDLISKIFKSTQKSEKEEDKQSEIITEVIPKIKQLQKYLGNRIFFFEKLTLADIYIYPVMKKFKKLFPDLYEEFANSFDPFFNNFESIPAIKSYHESDRYPK